MFEEILGVAEAAVGGAGEGAKNGGVGFNVFLLADVAKPFDDGLGGDAAKVEALAAGDDGGENFVGFGGAEDEDYVGGRLLQGLEEGVRGGLGEHVGFVDDVDLVAAFDGREVYTVADTANFVDAAVAGGVHFDEVHGASGFDVLAKGAAVVGLAVLGVEAAEAAGQNAGGGGLSGPARAAEEVGVGDAVLEDGLA